MLCMFLDGTPNIKNPEDIRLNNKHGNRQNMSLTTEFQKDRINPKERREDLRRKSSMNNKPFIYKY